MKKYKLYDNTRVFSLKELVEHCADTFSEKIAFRYEQGKKDISVSFFQFRLDVLRYGTYLYHKGYRRCNIAILGENSYSWILSHFSITCGESVVVPIDKDLSPGEIDYLLENSECRAIIYSDRYEDVIRQLSIPIDAINMKSIPEMLEKGMHLMESGCLDYSKIAPHKESMASIVYTSGTTGKPKGVMLSHNNFCSDMYGAACNVRFDGSTLLVLPLHHAFGLVAGVFVIMMYGHTVCINSSLKYLSADFQKYQPQNIFAVPLLVETIYKNIWITATRQGKDKLLKFLIGISNILLHIKIDMRKVFFKSILDSFGNHLNLIVSGGAPISEKYLKDFSSFGITVINGYGITECGPVVAVNRNDFIVSDSVGLPLCCNEVRIADNGEILVKGDNVMIGYYKDKEETETALSGGWFHTGDIGEIDKYGALHITGRVKNLIILGNGENVSSESIESELYKIPYIKEAVVYGKDNVIVAEVYLDENEEKADQYLERDIQFLNRRLPKIKNIGKIVIRKTEFPKTATNKIIRNNWRG